jgi:hypothetical protein
MEPAAAKGVTPEIVGEEIVATTEEIVTEVKEEVIEAPSRLREKFRRLEALWGRTAVQFYQAPKL